MSAKDDEKVSTAAASTPESDAPPAREFLVPAPEVIYDPVKLAISSWNVHADEKACPPNWNERGWKWTGGREGLALAAIPTQGVVCLQGLTAESSKTVLNAVKGPRRGAIGDATFWQGESTSRSMLITTWDLAAWHHDRTVFAWEYDAGTGRIIPFSDSVAASDPTTPNIIRGIMATKLVRSDVEETDEVVPGHIWIINYQINSNGEDCFMEAHALRDLISACSVGGVPVIACGDFDARDDDQADIAAGFVTRGARITISDVLGGERSEIKHTRIVLYKPPFCAGEPWNFGGNSTRIFCTSTVKITAKRDDVWPDSASLDKPDYVKFAVQSEKPIFPSDHLLIRATAEIDLSDEEFPLSDKVSAVEYTQQCPVNNIRIDASTNTYKIVAAMEEREIDKYIDYVGNKLERTAPAFPHSLFTDPNVISAMKILLKTQIMEMQPQEPVAAPDPVKASSTSQ